MSNRKIISNILLRKLISFYGGRRCVISNNTLNTDWHHLDENSANTVFTNLVPIYRDYNNLLEQYRRLEQYKSGWIGIDPTFSPNSIILISRHHFLTGEVALSYGCARIATWMVRLYPKLFSSMSHISYSLEALYSAKHAAEQNLIIDIINRDFLPYIQEIPDIEKIQILEEIASIYQEYGFNKEAQEIFDKITSKIRLIDTDERFIREVRILRRTALINIQEQSRIIEAVENLETASSLTNKNSSNKAVGIINAIAWASMSSGNSTKAIDLLKPVIEHVFKKDGQHNPLLVAPWNAIETLLTYYSAVITKEKQNRRLTKSIEDQLKYIASRNLNNGLQLRPIAYKLSSQFKGYEIEELKRLYNEFFTPRLDKMSKSLNTVLKKITNNINL